MKRVLNAVFLLSLINVGVIMARSHPYQNVYFNFSVKDPENKFERDYWGLSFRKGLEHILETDTSSKIMFTGSNADVALNRWILPRKDRKRLVHTIRFEYADYYLDNFRWRRRVNQPVEEIFSLNPMNIKIMSVYKVLRQGEPGKTVLTIANDFEKPSPGWELYHDTIIGAAAHSGIKVFRITGSDVFSMGINIPYDSLTKNAQPLVVHASLQVFAFDARKIPSIVINVRNREKQDIYWKRADLWISSEVELNQWNEMVFSTEIPKSIPSPHEFKVYIWNPSKGNLYIDDVTIKVFEENQ